VVLRAGHRGHEQNRKTNCEKTPNDFHLSPP
jgi:hypothetical protein